MTSSPTLKHRMIYLSQILHNFFGTIGENQEEISAMLGEMKKLRREHVQYLCKDVPEKVIKEKKDLNQEEVLHLLTKIIKTAQQERSQAYQALEKDIWQNFLTQLGQEALMKQIPELAEVMNCLNLVTTERDHLLKERKNLQEKLQQITNDNDQMRETQGNLESELQKIKTQNDKLCDSVKAKKDYQVIIKKIRKELEEKKDLDMWRLKVLYNKVAALTRSDWVYPGAPKPPLYDARSKEAQDFLESL